MVLETSEPLVPIKGNVLEMPQVRISGNYFSAQEIQSGQHLPVWTHVISTGHFNWKITIFPNQRQNRSVTHELMIVLSCYGC